MSDDKKKVAVGLSGGVDSAVSAYLLKSQGYDVTGVHMQCWDYSSETCKGNEDRSDAVAVCGQLGIKFEFLNFENEYKSKVIDYFYSEYQAGRTPNPDVLCNKEIKFGLFLDWAMKKGFDFVATGHYARISGGVEADATAFSSRALECESGCVSGDGAMDRGVGRPAKRDRDPRREHRAVPTDSQPLRLLRGVDDSKDQSYFLYRLTQDQLAKTLFPLGGMKKSEVRQIAEEQKLVVANKAESMGICFVGEVDINKFLKERIQPREGELILKSTGEVIGRHEGVWFYTIGQRHGFEVTKYVGLPLYVVGKDVDQNRLIVGYYNDCLVGEFQVIDAHFISNNLSLIDSGTSPTANTCDHFTCEVRIRHLGQLYPARVSWTTKDALDVGLAGDGFVVKLEQPAFGVAPGQSAVFYQGDMVLGGGIIN